MDEFVLDPGYDARPAPLPGRIAELRETIVRDARARAQRAGVELVVEASRRSSDVALLWFSGERRPVLAIVGDWEPDEPVELQIAHAGPRGARYELALYVVVKGDPSRAAD